MQIDRNHDGLKFSGNCMRTFLAGGYDAGLGQIPLEERQQERSWNR